MTLLNPLNALGLYKMLPSGGVFRADVGAIPPDPANRDWREYQTWLAAGNTADAADVPPGLSPGGPVAWQKLLAVLVLKGVIKATDLA